MGVVVPELVHLAEDLGLVRDLGQYEPDRVYLRQVEDARLELGALDEVQLVHEVIARMARLEASIGLCRRRGMLG